MKRLAAWRSFVWAWLFRSQMEQDMDAEMRFHLEARAVDLVAQGLSRAEAERRAREEFGDIVRWKEAGRDARGLRFVDELAADLRYAVRTMRRTPGFTAAAVVSLALGIGANTAIFGLMDLLLFRPVPVERPGELVHVTTGGERGSANSGSSNYPWFLEVAARTDLFTDAMLTRYDRFKLGIDGAVEPITGQRVTTNYYRLLGVPVVLGRSLGPGDEPGAAGFSPVAVISYGLWQRRFGGSTDVIGASITVDQRVYTIVGVTPREFSGILRGWTIDVTMPLDPSEFMDPALWYTMPLIARVRPGVDAERIAAQLTPILERFATDTQERFRQRYLGRAVVESAAAGITDLRVQFSTPLRLLMASVGVLLLIACGNLAGLLVARNTARQHELGIRLALGAGRGRVVRQLLTESALLAVIGAVPGVLLGVYGSNLLLRFTPETFGPVSSSVSADGRVLLFALVATIATTALFGLIPAWQAARGAIAPQLARTNPRVSTARVQMGRALVIAQFALSVVLVAGATLSLRTLLNLSNVDVGFDRGHVLIAGIDPQGTGYEGASLRTFQREMLAALARLPGVHHVSLATGAPFNGNVNGWRLIVPGVEPRDPDDGIIQVNLVGADYFAALGLPMLNGRAIDAGDRENTRSVVVVGESFARRYFGDAASAVGRSFSTQRAGDPVVHEIVGVARDVRYQGLRTESERIIYLPWFQDTEVRSTTFEFIIGTEGPPDNFVNIVRAEIQRTRPDAPVLSIRSMDGVIDRRLLSERLLATLGTFFAVVALVLAAVGVYGLLAHLVARSVPEIGVRLALGAQPSEMVWATLRENLVLALSGCAIGIAIAAVGLRVLERFLFGLSPADLGNLAGAACILVLVSLAAGIVPARRAATVDPLVALRAE